jgi:hypothetical protein
MDDRESLFADMIHAASHAQWWATSCGTFGGCLVSMDSNYWPVTDFQVYLGEYVSPNSLSSSIGPGSTFLVQFKGMAEVSVQLWTVQWKVNGVTVGNGSTLPFGTGYDSKTNTTTAYMVASGAPGHGFLLNFAKTSRSAMPVNSTSFPREGVTEIHVMQPTTKGGSTPHPVGALFTQSALNLISHYSAIRAMGLNATNGNLTSEWTDRSLPANPFWQSQGFSSKSGIYAAGVSGGKNQSSAAGIPWEVQIALANAAQKDLYINIPSNASPTYLTNLANLFAYGSDGVNPYTSTQSNPVWPPLNSDLKLYIEFSNELWNSRFQQSFSNDNGWAYQLSSRAVYDYLTQNTNDSLYPGGGANGYNDGAVLANYWDFPSNSCLISQANPSAVASYSGWSPQYFPSANNCSTPAGWAIGQSWLGLRLVQISTVFKAAFGETGISATDPNARIRPLYEWQYGGAWSQGLPFIRAVYGSQHPVNYYLYGGGGGWYAGAEVRGFSEVQLNNPYFRDGLSGWTVIGTAGTVLSGDASQPPTAPPTFSALSLNGGASESGNTVTLQTVATHSFEVGDTVTVIGVANSKYNGTFPITTVGAQTLTYTSSQSQLPDSGGGIVVLKTPKASSGIKPMAYLNPGASLSQAVTFPSGGYAGLSYYAAQSTGTSAGLAVTLTPLDNGPAITIANAQGSSACTSNSCSVQWVQTTGFNTGNSSHQYRLTFKNTLRTGTVYLTSIAVQTVNGMFAEAALPLATSAFDISANIQSDIRLASTYGLKEVGYEGGFFFDGNQANTGYGDMAVKGYSVAVPTVGLYANLDPRTQALAETTMQQFFSSGGTIAFVFEATGNLNSWAVAGPSYFDINTPKLTAVDDYSQSIHPPTYGASPGTKYSTYWLGNQSGYPSSLSGLYLLSSTGNYTATLSCGANSRASATTDTVQVWLDGILIQTLSINPKTGGSAVLPLGTLSQGQHNLTVVATSPSSNPLLASPSIVVQ